MKKGIFILCLLSLLQACHCTYKIPQPALSSSTPSQIPPAEETSQTAEPFSQTTSTQPHSSSANSTTNKQQTTLVSTTSAASVTTKPSTAVVSSAEFTAQQAEKLIAKDRANQTLAKPQADAPSFKKETVLSTDGRRLSPLSYEPIVADTTKVPWSNENLQYGLYYSFIKAGTAYIKTRGLTEVRGKKAYLIQTTAISASVIDSVFKVRDINYSWIDTTTFHSLGYSQSLREGNYKRDEWVTFEPKNGYFYGEIQKKGDPRPIAGPLNMEVLDMLSSLYYVRTQPLQEGKDITFDIINREKQYPLVVKVLGKETVKTEAGKFNCWVVEPQFRGEGIFVAKGKSLKVWLTDDEYRMPVKMSVEVFIGSVYAELLAYQRN